MNFRDFFHVFNERNEQPNARFVAAEYTNKIISFFNQSNWQEILKVFKSLDNWSEPSEMTITFPEPLKLGAPWFPDEQKIRVKLKVQENNYSIQTAGGGFIHFSDHEDSWLHDYIEIELSSAWIDDFYILNRLSRNPHATGNAKYAQQTIKKFYVYHFMYVKLLRLVIHQ